MKTIIIILAGFTILFSSCGQAQSPSTNTTNTTETTEVSTDSTDWNKLTAEEENVIVFKGTEYPGTGLYVDNHADGVYQCKRCNTDLFLSESKFESGTGWPSFDDFIEESVEVVVDADGYRKEIVCNTCKGHLGHVFYGEGFTDNNTRHCVNSISLNFIEK